MAKRCSLIAYCIGSEKNRIPEDQLLTCVLPDVTVASEMKVWDWVVLCFGLSWATLFWIDLRSEGGGKKSLSGVMSMDFVDCCRGVPNCYILTE